MMRPGDRERSRREVQGEEEGERRKERDRSETEKKEGKEYRKGDVDKVTYVGEMLSDR